MSDESDDGRPADDPWTDGWESATEHTVDESRADGEAATVDDGADPSTSEEEYEPSVAGVFGARPEDAPPRPEIVPESPSLENVLFVLVGVLFGLFVVYRAASVFTG